MAYCLLLPAESRIHDVFHVSLLKPYIESRGFVSSQVLPDGLQLGEPRDTPVRASASRTVLVDGVPQEQWRVHWASDESAARTWEPTERLSRDYPHLHLEDKVVVLEGGVDRDTTNEPHKDQHEDNSQDEDRSTKPKRKVTQPAKFKDFITY